MNENSSPLAPTLWRTFRVIANAKRLRCLRFVLKKPGSTVEQVARAVRISEAKASQALRAIQSRGLLAAHRQSRWLLSSPDPDASVVAAEAFLAALRSALLDERIPEAKIIEAATAYTHPRRIEIVRALAFTDAAEPHTLSVQLGISPPALRRHLGNLGMRGVVDNAKRRYSLAKAKNFHCVSCSLLSPTPRPPPPPFPRRRSAPLCRRILCSQGKKNFSNKRQLSV